MLGGEQRADEAAQRVGEHGRAFAAGGVEHRQRVLRLLLDGVVVEHALGQPGAAAVEQDQPPERGEPLEEAAVGRRLPEVLDLRDPAGQEQQVEAAVADDLVGDRRVAAARVAGLRDHARPPISARNGRGRLDGRAGRADAVGEQRVGGDDADHAGLAARRGAGG